MLRRNRQIKMQIQQALDACLFGCSFWIAWSLRSNPSVMQFLHLKQVRSYDAYFCGFYLSVIFFRTVIAGGTGLL